VKPNPGSSLVEGESIPLPPNVQRALVSDAMANDSDPPILIDPDGQFTRNLNRCHFLFSHGLKNHPLFQLPSLIELAGRPLGHGAYWSTGPAQVTDRWDVNGGQRHSLVDTITNIGENNSLVIFKKVAQDPVYGALFQELLARVVAVLGEQIRQEIVTGEASIVISSPKRVTSYHMDADCNFLMQVVGNKTLWVYDHNDRALVPHEAREDFYAVT
jgi:hypothetical protein